MTWALLPHPATGIPLIPQTDKPALPVMPAIPDIPAIPVDRQGTSGQSTSAALSYHHLYAVLPPFCLFAAADADTVDSFAVAAAAVAAITLFFPAAIFGAVTVERSTSVIA